MRQVDYEILVVITSGISILMGLYMLLLSKSTSGVKGIRYWASGSLLIGFGLLFKLIPPHNGFLPVVMPTLFTASGLYLYLAGIWRFKEKEIVRWVVFGFPIANLVQSILFFYVFPLPRIRVALYAIFLAVYCTIAIYEMLKIAPEQKYLQNLFRMNAISFFVFLGLLGLSIVSMMNTPNFDPSIINRLTLIKFAISGFVMIALTFGFISAVNLHLQTKLEGQLVSKNKFLKIIAHDLRGSVGTMMNFLNFLNNEPDLIEDKRQYYLEKLEELSESTFHLLQNLFEWSSNSNSLVHFNEEVFELNNLIAGNIEHFKSLAKLKSIHLEYEKGTNAEIKGHKKMLETVVRNLLSNALKFTPEKGKISIGTQQNGDMVQLCVKDTGVGIPSEKLEKIFNFEASSSSSGTNGEVGSGFGLVVCHDFIQKNRGTIQIKSQLNQGTEVILEFPTLN